MASAREVEHRSASACSYESSTIAITDDAWTINSDTDQQLTDDADDNNEHEQPVKCTLLSPGTSIRVAPMERATSGWSTEHFHQNLKLPEGSNAGRGIIVQFEAMARECIAIALSPYHQYELGKTYVVHFGANGNLQTVIRRHVNYNEAVDLTFPSRVCSENHWIPYWICLQNGTLSAGVGKCVGKNVIGSLDDSMYNMLRSGVDAVRYVGVGNSALNRNARDLRVRNVAVMSIPGRFGLEGVPMEAQSAFVNILDMEYATNNNGSGGGGGAQGIVPALAAIDDIRLSEITVESLLRMAGGLAIAETNTGMDPNSEMLFTQSDMPRYAATRERLHAPGEHWQYMSGNTILATDTMQRLLGETLPEQVAGLRARIFEPLGIYSAIMEPGENGVFQGSSYMYATAQDWARLNQLYLDNGVVNGERLLPEDWYGIVAEPTPGSNGEYGMGFWLPNERSTLPPETIMMSGFQGQWGYVMPEQELVIVRFGATTGVNSRSGSLANAVRASLQPPADTAQTSAEPDD